MVDYIIIMAGGSGTRLWPASTKELPKQFMDAGRGKSFIQLSIERADKLLDSSRKGGEIIIVAHLSHLSAIKNVFGTMNLRHSVIILAEPEAKNTAPALALASRYIAQSSGLDKRALVMTADHIISPLENLKKDVEKADYLASKDYIVSFGIVPNGPETGFGYIEAGAKLEDGYKIRRFTEKPDREKAQDFLRQGGFYWNSGMFVFKTGFFMEELLRYTPGVGKSFKDLSIPVVPVEGLKDLFVCSEGLDEVYAQTEKISIDYALMEKTERSALVSATFDWEDIGSWDEYAALVVENQAQNVLVNAKNNFIDSDLPVAISGVDDLIVVLKNGKLLICRKGESQSVKTLVDKMREKNLLD